MLNAILYSAAWTLTQHSQENNNFANNNTNDILRIKILEVLPMSYQFVDDWGKITILCNICVCFSLKILEVWRCTSHIQNYIQQHEEPSMMTSNNNNLHLKTNRSRRWHENPLHITCLWGCIMSVTEWITVACINETQLSDAPCGGGTFFFMSLHQYGPN